MYDAITDIMSNGRTSRMYRSMVRDQKIAAAAAGFSRLPRHEVSRTCLPSTECRCPDTPMPNCSKGIQEQINKLKTEDVTDDELAMFKTRTKADLIRGLASNSGLAQQLAIYQTRYGDWRELFKYLDKVDKVNKADIRRVANKVFVEGNRTNGSIETVSAPAAAKGARLMQDSCRSPVAGCQ